MLRRPPSAPRNDPLFPTRRSSDLIVSGPNLSVADPEKANLGAYGTAYKAARAKADAYAAAANLRVTRVLAISDGGQGGYMPQMADMEARIAAPPTVVPQAAPPVMAGTNMNRSEERRGGKECVTKCRSRWAQSHVTKKTLKRRISIPQLIKTIKNTNN